MMTKKILFYTSTNRNFRTTLLGYLYELQEEFDCEIILLTERLDDNIMQILLNKKLFPKIISTIEINQYSNYNRTTRSLFLHLNSLSKKVVNEYNPDFVITTSDFHSTFELLLCRYSKRKKIHIITISATINPGKMTDMSKWIDLCNAHEKFGSYPIKLATLIVKFRKYLAHYVIHLFIPISCFIKPLLGKSSYILYRGHTGMRYSDFHVVFSNKEAKLYIESGVDENKIVQIEHPLTRNYNELLFLIRENSNILILDFLILLPVESIGFKKENFELINEEQRSITRDLILKNIVETFPDAIIGIKPHPLYKKNEELYNKYKKISNNIIIINPNDSIDDFVQNTNVIIELPRAVSTSLFMSALQNKSSLIFSLDFDDEFLGDYYQNSNSVILIKNLFDFDFFLKRYKNNEYKKTFKEKKLYKSAKIYTNLDQLLYQF